MRELQIGSMVSGNGSVLKTLLRACASGDVAGQVAAVASNKVCPALDIARNASIAAQAFPIDQFESRSLRDAAIAEFFVVSGVNFVVIGGYDEPLEEAFFVDSLPEVISMYPATLPAFGELDEAIGPALNYGVKKIAVTIHYREPLSLSGGPIIAQESLAVDIDDTVEGVTARIIELEGRFLPAILSAFNEGRITREGHRVRVKGTIEP